MPIGAKRNRHCPVRVTIQNPETLSAVDLPQLYMSVIAAASKQFTIRTECQRPDHPDMARLGEQEFAICQHPETNLSIEPARRDIFSITTEGHRRDTTE